MCLQACAALDTTEAESDASPDLKCVLKTLRLRKHVMHFAADDKAGVMACVSLTQPLHTSIAAAFVEVSPSSSTTPLELSPV